MNLENSKVYLAIDIGASSGRHIVGWRDASGIQTDEAYRFPNGVKNENGHLVWDIDALMKHVIEGIKVAFEKYPRIESLAIDTWGCDYVLMTDDGERLPCFAYRDHRTESVIDEAHERMLFTELYARTGIQFQPFNTLYQLCEDAGRGRLATATDFLMMPEYIAYKLTGRKAKEYTNATTTGLVNAGTGTWDRDVVRAMGFPERLFPALHQPGVTVGELREEIAREVGGQCKVVLCATHDTASAVEGIPMEEDALYLSSGTWSLLGVKSPKPLTDENSRRANYSNEGGVGYIRYQKNIMGMWLINELRRELCPDKDIRDIVREAEQSVFDRTVDANAPAFLSPKSMRAAFEEALGMPMTEADLFRCAMLFLAECYASAIRELESNTGKRCDSLYIVGGGAKNAFLNRLTEAATGKRVIALPIEATAIGNLKIQMEASL